MSASAKQALAAGLSGLLFGAGLVISGMTNPNKILGFLDVFGAWDGSLMWVMAGAIGVHALAYRWIRRRPAPLFDSTFRVPTRRDLDARLVLGAGLFGVGWGLSGYCPGPSVVALASLRPSVVVFVAALAVGSIVTAQLEARFTGREVGVTPQRPPADASAAE
jgi:uncharacterized membrane protein YedE/YeeE